MHANSLADDGLHPTAYPWPHKGWFDTFDHARHVRPYTNLASHSLALASVVVSTSTAKSVLLAIPSTALPGATSLASPIPPTKQEFWQSKLNTPMVPTTMAKCSNAPENYPIICLPHTPTRRPLVPVMPVHFLPTSA